jgi:hypothetical protein
LFGAESVEAAMQTLPHKKRIVFGAAYGRASVNRTANEAICLLGYNVVWSDKKGSRRFGGTYPLPSS